MNEEVIIPLDLNESYWLLDDETLALMRDIPRAYLSTYPSYAELQQDIASYVGVSAHAICVTPGSDEAIRAAIRYCSKQNYRALLVLPTFSGYERVLMETPLETKRLYYTEQGGAFEFPLQEVLSHIAQKDVDVVFLCEPNNPLGSVLGEEAFNVIMDAAKKADVLIVSDEAYGEYGGTCAIGRTQTQGVIVLRTLSKAFGVPGIRVGYAISSPEIARALSESLFGTLPWIIPGPSVHAARVVLARVRQLLERKKLVMRQRGLFSSELAKLPGMVVYPSHGNFVLARHPNASELAQSLLAANIRVAEGERKTWDDTAKALLRSTLRIAVPAPEHTAALLEVLQNSTKT